MTFEEEILDFSKDIIHKKRGITTEETTKIALVLPFLKKLGYDTENPDELKAEYAADVGVKKSEKVDFAVLIDGEVQMLIECKPVSVNLTSNHLEQLQRYYSVSDVKIAVLTNGAVYQFFTDFDSPGRMDGAPFLEVDLRNLGDRQIESLALFRRDNFNLDKILDHVEELKYRQGIHDALLGEIKNPDDDLIRLISRKVYSGVISPKRFKVFSKLVREELVDVFENDYVLDDDEIITTEIEMEGYCIVKAILADIVDLDRVVMRDRKSYCGILFDDNARRPICRLYFNDIDNLVVEFFDSLKNYKKGAKIGEKIRINNVNEIYQYRDKLIDTVNVYLRMKK